jgi:hypothetical protein
MESILTELKPKSRNHRSSKAIRAEIESAPIEARHCRNIALAAELDAADAERFCIFHACSLKGGDFSDVIDNSRGMYLKLGERLTTATSARHLANLLAASPEVVEARAILDPLHVALEASLAGELIEADQAARAVQDVRQARESARLELESKLDDHPLVVAAKAAPFYRKGELVTG